MIGENAGSHQSTFKRVLVSGSRLISDPIRINKDCNRGIKFRTSDFSKRFLISQKSSILFFRTARHSH